jgi:hypothetical protein
MRDLDEKKRKDFRWWWLIIAHKFAGNVIKKCAS